MSLTPGQLANVRAEHARQADQLDRLTARVERPQFPTRDPMRVQATRARKAAEELLRNIPIKPPRNA